MQDSGGKSKIHKGCLVITFELLPVAGQSKTTQLRIHQNMKKHFRFRCGFLSVVSLPYYKHGTMTTVSNCSPGEIETLLRVEIVWSRQRKKDACLKYSISTRRTRSVGGGVFMCLWGDARSGGREKRRVCAWAKPLSFTTRFICTLHHSRWNFTFLFPEEKSKQQGIYILTQTSTVFENHGSLVGESR